MTFRHLRVAHIQNRRGARARQGRGRSRAEDLTASDGTGLVLVSLTARVVVEDPLAFTELHLVFQNPEPRQLEGRFRIGLPSGASVSRFAMRIGTTWQEGEVVERQAARRAYEDFLHRRQDPALLEHEAGNEFSARVFPIEANSRKEILVSYGHELTGEEGRLQAPSHRAPGGAGAVDSRARGAGRRARGGLFVARGDLGELASRGGAKGPLEAGIWTSRSGLRPWGARGSATRTSPSSA